MCVICVNYLVYLSPVFCIPFRLVYLLFPVCLPCPVLPLMLSLKTMILKYFLVCVFLVSPCCVHRDRRPDQTVSVVPSPRFVLFVFSSVLFCSRVLSLAASESARREPWCPPFAGVYAAVRGSSIPRFAGVYAAVRGSPIPRFAGLHAAVRGSWRRRSRLSDPAVRGSSRRRSRINQPTVHRRWRHHPRLTLARRPAADSMPAGLPLTQCPPACLWLNARRPAADSSPPDCRWLKLAGLPLTHARWSSLAGKANSTPFCSRRRPRLTEPAVRGRSRRRPWGKPTHRRRLPLVRGESQPAVHGSLGPQPAVAPSSPPAPAVVWSSQPAAAVIVKPAGYGLASRPLPYWQASRPWP